MCVFSLITRLDHSEELSERTLLQNCDLLCVCIIYVLLLVVMTDSFIKHV